MQQRISSKEYIEWAAYDSLEPGYPERQDYHAAIVAWAITRCFTAKGKKPKIEDFLLSFKIPERQSQKTIKMTIMAWRDALMSMKDKKKGKKKDG